MGITNVNIFNAERIGLLRVVWRYTERGIMQQQIDIYTIEDIYALPDGERAELIDGRIYYMAPPSRTHQRLLLSLSRKIADYIDSQGGNCEIKNRITVYNFVHDTIEEYAFDEDVPVGIYEDFSIKVSVKFFQMC